jgi:hypothetical protein
MSFFSSSKSKPAAATPPPPVLNVAPAAAAASFKPAPQGSPKIEGTAPLPLDVLLVELDKVSHDDGGKTHELHASQLPISLLHTAQRRVCCLIDR